MRISPKVATSAIVFVLIITLPCVGQRGRLPGSWIHQTSEFRGEDVGAQLQACNDAAPESGGICDVRETKTRQAIRGLRITKPLQVFFGSGTFTVFAPIQIYNTAGVQIEGTGAPDLGSPVSAKQGTNFVWAGNTSDPMFRLSSAGKSKFENFDISASRSSPLAAAFLSENLSLSQTPGQNIFENIYIQGTDGAIKDGFRYPIVKVDAMNAEDTFIGVTVTNYSHAGWSFEATQSKAHRFYGCTFRGDGIGRYGIYVASVPGGGGGSFLWYGGFGSGNTSADFYLGAPDDAILISGGNFESSSRLLDTVPGNSATAFPVTIQGVRFSANKLNPDGHAIRFTHPGPLVLMGNIIGQMRGQPLDVVFQGHVGKYGRAVAIGNSFGTTLVNPLVGKEWVALGNLIGFSPVTGIVELPSPSPEEHPENGHK